MKKLVKLTAAAAAVLVLASAWYWRYDGINRYYQDYAGLGYESCEIGETLCFGDDYIDTGLRALGYSIAAEGFDIVEYEAVAEELGYTATMIEPPERVAIVEVTLKNDGSTDPGVMLPELMLHGLDFYTDMNLGLLVELNPVLEGNYGISLPDNSECRLTLPYNLRERTDIRIARRILDEDHFGLEKVKERILEILAVRQLAPEQPGQIICPGSFYACDYPAKILFPLYIS